MAETASRVPVTTAEFVAWESRQEARYEYLGGIVRMMVGGTLGHHGIGGNLFAFLHGRVRAQGCRIFQEAVKLTCPSGDVTYPDVMVVCGPVRPTDLAATNPVLIAEVLSPSTEPRDRGEKWQAYQSIDALRHYLLIHQTHWCVELFTRCGAGWETTSLTGQDAAVPLSALDITVPLAALYEDTGLPVHPQPIRGVVG